VEEGVPTEWIKGMCSSRYFWAVSGYLSSFNYDGLKLALLVLLAYLKVFFVIQLTVSLLGSLRRRIDDLAICLIKLPSAHPLELEMKIYTKTGDKG
jgi:hypothetical protein